MSTFIFPSQKGKPKEEQTISHVKYKDMTGDYNIVFKNVAYFEDEETGKLYIPHSVRLKMRELMKKQPNEKEIVMPSLEEIEAEV